MGLGQLESEYEVRLNNICEKKFVYFICQSNPALVVQNHTDIESRKLGV